MLTYRVRQRVLRIAREGATLVFPGTASINFYFVPPQPFGVAADGGRTCVRAVKATALFNANTGQHSIESAEPLRPLTVIIQEEGRHVALEGNRLTVELKVESLQALTELLESVYYALPMLLSVEFADSPYIERVDGSIEGVPFRWELARWKASFWPTTQAEQEQAVVRAWDRLGILSNPERRRLLASLHYFHTATRLLAASVTPGEFLAEALLNFAKCLEALFPSSAGKGTIDAAREGLEGLGFQGQESEARFIPAIALRNRIDVGHVDLTLFTRDQLTVLHQYAESAEGHFKALFKRLFARLADGTFQLTPGYPKAATAEDKAVIDRLTRTMNQDGAA